MEYTINFTWDNEANVWIATSEDIPGLVLESGSFDALLERTRFAVPELLELNSSEVQGGIKETLEAFAEVDEMKKTGKGQRFQNLDELWASLEK